MQEYQQHLPPAGPSGHSVGVMNPHAKRKNFTVNYDPDNNKNNIYMRKLNKEQLPESKDLFAQNPLTRMLQPYDITKSKRFARDKLNISDIPGAQPDVYKKQRFIEGREYIDTGDIEGARPATLKQNKPHSGPDYKFYTKDINPDKWQTRRLVDPQMPIYEVPTKSGRKMRIGQIERSAPKITISPQTKRIANYVGDIDGTRPRQGYSINDEQRIMAFQNGELKMKPQSGTRNPILFNQNNDLVLQEQILNQQSNSGPAPKSHYARFQTYQNTQATTGITLNPEQSTFLQQSQQQTIPVKSGYRQKYSNQMLNKPIQNLSQDLGYDFTLNQQQPINLNERLASKRVNTYQLLESKYGQSQSNSQQELNKQYINMQNGPYTNNIYQPNASESPVMNQDRKVWSKARNVGGEVISQPNMRINQSISQNQGIENTISIKRNFNQNIYEKGVLMNSGHKSFINSGQNQINPLSNEVNKSVDNVFFRKDAEPMSRDQRLSKHAYFNPITSETNKLGISSSSNIMPQKPLIPPTTSKIYGNFLDGKQLDQMISQLKQQNLNPII